MKIAMKNYGFMNLRNQHWPKVLCRKHFQASGFPISKDKLFSPFPIIEVPNILGSRQPSQSLSYGLSPQKMQRST